MNHPGAKVTREELLELYQSIKSAETIGVFDAAEALGNDDVATARNRLADARVRYERKHARALARDLDGETNEKVNRKSEARKAQVHAALAKFSTYLAVLEKQVKIQRAVPKPQPDPLAFQKKQAAAAIVQVPSELIEEFRTLSAEAALELLQSRFDVQEIDSEAGIHPNTIYAVQSKSRWHLLRTAPEECTGEVVSFWNLLTRKEVRSITKTEFLKAAKRRQALMVRSKREAEARATATSAPREEIVLDESELNVLWAVVRDTGLLPNASDITLIKKNEFVKRQYDQALKKMLILQRGFNAGVRNKRNEFSRELAQLEAQKQTMSLREVEKRKLKIAREKRLIERAEAHFIKVMNCLHALDSRRSN